MLHQGLDKAAAREKSIEMLRLVGIPRLNSAPTTILTR